MSDEWLPPKRASELTAEDPQTLRRWAKHGKLEHRLHEDGTHEYSGLAIQAIRAEKLRRLGAVEPSQNDHGGQSPATSDGGDSDGTAAAESSPPPKTGRLTPPPERSASAVIYVASPLGFTEPTRRYYLDVLLPTLEAAGMTPLDPWSAPFDDMAVALSQTDLASRFRLLDAANRRHGAHNADLIARADGVLAVLDGPDVDSGTAVEIGYASALGRPIVGWRSDLRVAGDNEATPVNLQVQHFISATGGVIVSRLDAAVLALSELLGERPRTDA
jgi:nucleoside 2-deoxyribosyltransferase